MRPTATCELIAIVTARINATAATVRFRNIASKQTSFITYRRDYPTLPRMGGKAVRRQAKPAAANGDVPPVFACPSTRHSSPQTTTTPQTPNSVLPFRRDPCSSQTPSQGPDRLNRVTGRSATLAPRQPAGTARRRSRSALAVRPRPRPQHFRRRAASTRV